MARTALTITEVYQLASAITAVFTVRQAGEGTLIINDVNTDDDAAERVSKDTPGIVGLQFEQGLAKNTYMRATGTGWVVLIEEG